LGGEIKALAAKFGETTFAIHKIPAQLDDLSEENVIVSDEGGKGRDLDDNIELFLTRHFD